MPRTPAWPPSAGCSPTASRPTSPCSACAWACSSWPWHWAATLTPGHGTEIGFGPVEVTAPDPVLAPLGPEPAVLHWHSDAVSLPPGAELLASTALTPVQAFRAGSALGLQFHLEVDGALLTTWLASDAMPAELAEHGITDLPQQAEIALPVLVPGARHGLASFAARARDRA